MNNKNIKLFALDMDGTCLDQNHKLRQITYDTIKKLSEDYMVIPCSGRGYDNLRSLFAGVNIPYIICSNGAMVYDAKNDEQLFKYIIDYSVVEGIVNNYLDDKSFIYVNSDIGNKTVYGCKTLEIFDKYFRNEWKDNPSNNIIKDIQEYKDDIIKIGLWQYDNLTIEQIASEIQTKYTRYINVFRSDDIELEIASKMASKGSSLKKLCQYLNIESSQVCAIGDSGNDVDMLKFAGLSVAMGNAMDRAKANADIIIGNNSDDAVAKFLQENFIKQEGVKNVN